MISLWILVFVGIDWNSIQYPFYHNNHVGDVEYELQLRELEAKKQAEAEAKKQAEAEADKKE